MKLAVLISPSRKADVLKMIEAEAQGCLSMDQSPDEFANSIRLIAQGNMIISQDLVSNFVDDVTTSRESEAGEDTLSGREREVLALIGHGATNKEIADTLIVAENTVKVHLRNILSKLSLRNRQQAAVYAAQEGIVGEVEVSDDLYLENSHLRREN